MRDTVVLPGTTGTPIGGIAYKNLVIVARAGHIMILTPETVSDGPRPRLADGVDRVIRGIPI